MFDAFLEEFARSIPVNNGISWYKPLEVDEEFWTRITT